MIQFLQQGCLLCQYGRQLSFLLRLIESRFTQQGFHFCFSPGQLFDFSFQQFELIKLGLQQAASCCLLAFLFLTITAPLWCNITGGNLSLFAGCQPFWICVASIFRSIVKALEHPIN